MLRLGLPQPPNCEIICSEAAPGGPLAAMRASSPDRLDRCPSLTITVGLGTWRSRHKASSLQQKLLGWKQPLLFLRTFLGSLPSMGQSHELF